MDANYEEFERNFNKLCVAFGIDPTTRKSQCMEYFDSRLRNLSSRRFYSLIEKAKNDILVKSGFIPEIAALNNLAFSLGKEEFKTKNKVECPRCNGSGYVTMETNNERRYECLFVCTCPVGHDKKAMTVIGRESQFFIEGLDKRYKPLYFDPNAIIDPF